MFGIEKDFQNIMEQVYGPLGEKKQMTEKTNEPSGWNPVFEFPLDDRNTIIIDGVKYKRVEEPKSPAEIAYKRVYGFYPETYEDSWSSFQDGYIASQKDYKVGEYQPTPQEPTKDKVSLYKRFEDEGAYGQIYFDNALKVVRCFLIDEAVIENEDHEYITFTLQKSLLEVPND